MTTSPSSQLNWLCFTLSITYFDFVQVQSSVALQFLQQKKMKYYANCSFVATWSSTFMATIYFIGTMIGSQLIDR